MSFQSIKSVADTIRGKSSRAVALSLLQALHSPNLFFFGALMLEPDVLGLQQSSNEADVAVLEAVKILSFGTFSSLTTSPANVRALFDADLQQKLRQLTLLSIFSEISMKRNGSGGCAVVQYDNLFGTLGLKTPFELEEVVVEAVTNGLMVAKIDQQKAEVVCYSSAPRDLKDPKQEAATLIAVLKGWRDKCTAEIIRLDSVVEADRAEKRLIVENAVSLREAKENSVEGAKAALYAEGISSCRDMGRGMPPSSYEGSWRTGGTERVGSGGGRRGTASSRH